MADEKKRFLFVSLGALISDIAWQVVKEGHEVRYFIEDESEKSIGDGFVPKVDEWESHIDWADVIVFDDVLGLGEKAQQLRADGKHVVGGTVYTDRLEDDRSFGQEELKRHGVSFPSRSSRISIPRSATSRKTLRPTSSSRAARRRTSSVCCSSAGKTTAKTSSTYCNRTRPCIPTPSRCSSCSGACGVSR
jgi:phosphoribosylamine--glycine ligase